MPLSPAFLAHLDDIARADLEGFRDWYATCIFWSTFAVIVGCAMEVPEVLHEVWPDLFAKKFDKPIKVVSSIGLLFVVLGIAGELSFEHWRSGYEGLLQNFENILLVDAERHAASAQQEAGDAKDSATKAANASVLATSASGDALGIAKGARKEADSFEKDIVSAKRQAADAESHLADALREVIAAKTELARLESPRTLLIDPIVVKTTLERLKGTEYAFSAVFADSESIDLLKMIDGVLHDAGWKRVDLPIRPAGPAMNINNRDESFSVVSSLQTGIHVSVQSSNSPASLNAISDRNWPPNVWAGEAIMVVLANSLIPRPKTNSTLGVESGTSMIVSIDVGKKP
jgi:hypothetical protein